LRDEIPRKRLQGRLIGQSLLPRLRMGLEQPTCGMEVSTSFNNGRLRPTAKRRPQDSPSPA
jgi:hypothetical protein